MRMHSVNVIVFIEGPPSWQRRARCPHDKSNKISQLPVGRDPLLELSKRNVVAGGGGDRLIGWGSEGMKIYFVAETYRASAPWS